MSDGLLTLTHHAIPFLSGADSIHRAMAPIGSPILSVSHWGMPVKASGNPRHSSMRHKSILAHLAVRLRSMPSGSGVLSSGVRCVPSDLRVVYGATPSFWPLGTAMI